MRRDHRSLLFPPLLPHVLSFVSTQYALLLAFLLACWGGGRMALHGLHPHRLAPGRSALTPAMHEVLSAALGMALAACALQWLAVIGQLNRASVMACLAAGLLLAVLGVRDLLSTSRASAQAPATGATPSRWTVPVLAVAAAIALPTFIAPLAPPLAWDELMYHLPHAREWARHGRLTVDTWLRYPWFPYNFDLLFAGALLFDQEVLTHLIHASAGWLVACLVFEIARREAGAPTGAVATVLWMSISRGEYGPAYVDLGVALWVLAAALAFWQGWQTGTTRWWMAAAFLAGAAVGSKYQVLGIVPLLVGAFLWRERRWGPRVGAILAFLAPCGWWYLRNAWLAGDPVAPMGGSVFGFTDWNADDLQVQFADLRRNVGWPHPLLWAAPLAAFVPAVRRSPMLRAAAVLAAAQFALWLVSARYPRYLLPAYPLLCILAATGWIAVVSRATQRWRRPATVGWPRGLAVAVVVLAGVAGIQASASKLRLVASTPAQREQVLEARIPGYRLLVQLRAQPPGKLYQLHLEDTIYYLPAPVWGEVFGPWRYADYTALPPSAMRDKLHAQGFEALLVHTGRAAAVVAQPGFSRAFEAIRSDGPVTLYRIVPPAEAASGAPPP